MSEYNDDAKSVMTLLLDGQGDVELEYSNSTIDSMPHVTWMLRALGADTTQYLATETAHNREDAEKAATGKARLLGVRIVKVTDRTRR